MEQHGTVASGLRKFTELHCLPQDSTGIPMDSKGFHKQPLLAIPQDFPHLSHTGAPSLGVLGPQ